MRARVFTVLIASLGVLPLGQPDTSVSYPAKPGAGKGKHVVLLSGDEEYRSEEALPMLGKILSQRHGFKSTVLFSVDPDGTINPKAGEVAFGSHRPRHRRCHRHVSALPRLVG